eukprot:TRINITY_DN22065_c0_g1_i1.p1 TRINITY_DN22065_c0_g1~~TRINITY_DN22065_c0_g1_i1.p1  ORF type:complete len:631 (-),score=94.77 TRINITY_DN22065_c0_g1_i1:16-1908(-)
MLFQSRSGGAQSSSVYSRTSSLAPVVRSRPPPLLHTLSSSKRPGHEAGRLESSSASASHAHGASRREASALPARSDQGSVHGESSARLGDTASCVALWFALSPAMMTTQDLLLNSQDLAFPCPWLTVSLSSMLAAALLGIGEPLLSSAWRLQQLHVPQMRAPLLESDDYTAGTTWAWDEGKKRAVLLTVVLGILQGIEAGLGNLAQMGMTVSMRAEVHMLTPGFALLAALLLRWERPTKPLLAAVACVTVGGALAVPGRLDVTNMFMVPVAILVRCLVVVKWVVLQLWLQMAPDATLAPCPPTLRLASRILALAALVALQLNWFFQNGCSGALFSLPRPGRVIALLLLLSCLRAFYMAAEVRSLRLASTTLLGFLHPLRFVAVDLLGSYSERGSLEAVQVVGSILCLTATVLFQQTRESLGEHLEFTEPLLSGSENGGGGGGASQGPRGACTGESARNAGQVRLLECHKTILNRGDGQTYPKPGDSVTVKYTGCLTRDGAVFDSGVVTFSIGLGQVIDGWDAGILTMSLGETAALAVPHAFGYGARGLPPRVPPYADLTFHIQLLNVIPGARGCPDATSDAASSHATPRLAASGSLIGNGASGRKSVTGSIASNGHSAQPPLGAGVGLLE